MLLSKQIRSDIAEHLIRIVVPVIIAAAAAFYIVIFIVVPEQRSRYLPTTFAVIAMIPPYLFIRKGKPLTGSYFLIAGLVATILLGMYANGGVYAPVFTLFIVLVTVVVNLYGVLKAIMFLCFAIAYGAVCILLEHLHLMPSWSLPPPGLMLAATCIWLFMALFFNAIPANLMQKAIREKELAENELQSIISNTPDVIYRLNAEGQITFMSDAIRRYGYTPEIMLGHHIVEYIHPDDKTTAERRLQSRRMGQKITQDLEVRFLRAQEISQHAEEKTSADRWVTFHVVSEGLYSHDPPSPGSYIGSQGIARDISMTKLYAEQLNQLAAVVEQAAEDVIITDTDGTIKYVNPKFEEVTGYSRTEIIGKKPNILKSGKHNKYFYANLWNTIKNGTTWKGRIWNRINNGSLILQDVTITPIFDTTQKLTGYASVRRDITEQIKIEDQLQQAQKMEAIGTLAGGIAHDFNNILTGMIGYAELAIDDVKDIPSTRKKLDRVIESGGRATDLVKQILSFSRSQKSELRPVSPLTITKEVLKLIRASLPATIEIEHSVDSDSNVLADATNIHQVLMNLCTNAGHAMRETGGVLTIRLEDVDLDEKYVIRHAGMAAGKFIRISVEDTGHGIPPDIQQKVFDPFFTTKALGEGTGMGLSAVHGILKDLGGTVTLSSEVGKGTAVHVLLPVIPEVDAAVESQDDENPLVGGTERILFVDDEQIQIELAQDALGRMGYQVEAFLDGVSALRHFDKNPGGYDLIITDMTMPKMTGDILVKEIHQTRKDIPVIMCTGFSEIIDEQKAKAMNISAFLYKPVVIKDLLQVIRRVLDKK